MRGLQVHGLACPWNVYNCFGERFPEGAFKQFISDLKGNPLEMGFMHEGRVGHWNNLVEGSDGLYASGVITNPKAIAAFERGLLPELSVTWRWSDRVIDRRGVETTRLRYESQGPYRQSIYHKFKVPIVEKQTVYEAFLKEISLVDRGAFKGTWVRQ